MLRRDGRESAAADLRLLVGCYGKRGGPCQGRPLSLRAVAAFSVTAVRAHYRRLRWARLKVLLASVPTAAVAFL